VAAVLVHIDLTDAGTPDPSSLVALAAGRHVASSWGATLYAAIVVEKTPGHDAAEEVLSAGGADKIVVAVTGATIAPLWSSVGGAWQTVLDHLRPRLVLFGADAPSAVELAPRTAARIGARLLMRARASGIDDVELRDRDGGYARAIDGGAAVAMVGRAAPTPRADADIDLVVLETKQPPDTRIELVATLPAEVAHACGAVVALGDDVASDAKLVANARKLADMMDAFLVGNAGAAKAGVVATGAVVERTTPMAPELVVTIGGAQLDVAGATSLIKIGASVSKTVDGALPGLADVGLAELVKRLERM
jgi:hypothetical protein